MIPDWSEASECPEEECRAVNCYSLIGFLTLVEKKACLWIEYDPMWIVVLLEGRLVVTLQVMTSKLDNCPIPIASEKSGLRYI